MLLVPRTCVRQSDTKDEPVAKPILLSDTRALTAYVLLGDPGSGKTEAFGREADAGGGHHISAGDFLALDHPELQNSTLPVFIDGLDETRAGTVDGRVPLDSIRKKLQQLGCRSFRLSCRAADWLGSSDAAKLQLLLPLGEQVQVFTLHSLTLADVSAILPANHGITDPQAFITSAEQHGLTDLLFNPQTLEMLATAVGPDNRWPETRLAVYEMACDRLVQEHNDEHVAATRNTASDQGALQRAAAYLCAIQLIADLAGFTHSPNPSDRVLRLNAVPNPQGLPLDEALASRLFAMCSPLYTGRWPNSLPPAVWPTASRRSSRCGVCSR
jgi:phage tail protein X